MSEEERDLLLAKADLLIAPPAQDRGTEAKITMQFPKCSCMLPSPCCHKHMACAARVQELEAKLADCSKEYHAAINEAEYAGTRADWIHRAQAAEAKVQELERARDLFKATAELYERQWAEDIQPKLRAAEREVARLTCKHCGHNPNAPFDITHSVAVDHPGRPVAAPCTISGCHYGELERLEREVAELKKALQSLVVGVDELQQEWPRLETQGRIEELCGFLFASVVGARAVLAGTLPQKNERPHHKAQGDSSTICGAARERGNTYYEWAYVNCPACLSTRPESFT